MKFPRSMASFAILLKNICAITLQEEYPRNQSDVKISTEDCNPGIPHSVETLSHCLEARTLFGFLDVRAKDRLGKGRRTITNHGQYVFDASSVLSSDDGLSWTRCAGEGSLCKCDSRTVRFGVKERWEVMTFIGDDDIHCTLKSFNTAANNHAMDPYFAVMKECWCQVEGNKNVQGTVRNYFQQQVGGFLRKVGSRTKPPTTVAVVLKSRKAPDLETWMKYQLNFMQFKQVFIEVDDKDDSRLVKKLQLKWPGMITLWEHDDYHPQNLYKTLQAKQIDVMKRGKEAAAAMGIEWLIHHDDDELLYIPSDININELFSTVPQDIDEIFLTNIEASYGNESGQEIPTNGTQCFTQTYRAVTNTQKYASYVNGKPAIRTNARLEPRGPHLWNTPGDQTFTAKSIHWSDKSSPFGSPIYLIHYESCPQNKWREKFVRLAERTSTDDIASIPFPFYRASIQVVKSCSYDEYMKQQFVALESNNCKAEGRVEITASEECENAAKRFGYHFQDMATANVPAGCVSRDKTIIWNVSPSVNFQLYWPQGYKKICNYDTTQSTTLNNYGTCHQFENALWLKWKIGNKDKDLLPLSIDWNRILE